MNMIRVVLPLMALMSVLALGRTAQAQQDADPIDLLENFIHYTMIAKPDLAVANGELLLTSGMTNAELAELLDDRGRTAIERFDVAVKRAQFIPELEFTAADLARRIERGRLDLARNEARIEEAIQMLTGNVRARRLAEARLQAAGEYAVPHLLRRITDGQDEVLKTICGQILVDIGRVAVTPLCVALPEVDPASQRLICDMVGQIGYPHAAPYLKMIASEERTADYVRDAAVRAFERVGGVDADLAVLFSSLGQQYFNESSSLIAYPGEQMNNVWSYTSFGGLLTQPVRTEIFSEIMAMKMTSTALQYDSDDRASLSLFVASNLRRANELPPGAEDQIFGDLPYTPTFYATVFGTRTCQDVLAMALDSGNTPLIRDAINALSQTTGGSNLFEAPGDRLPLVEALRYPDRRTQYEAALVLGSALPEEGFASDFRVVPTLASAVRSGNRQFAVVVASTGEDIGTASALMTSLGFEVAASGSSVSQVQDAVAELIVVDLVFIQADSPDQAESMVRALRIEPKMEVAPVLIDAPVTEAVAIERRFRADNTVMVSRARADEQALQATVDDLMQRAVGGRMTEIEAMEYTIQSLDTMRDIAIAGSTVYDLRDAEAALIDALGMLTGRTREMAADVLALINSRDAQHALLDAAINAAGSDQVMMLERVAQSVKRYGSMADARHEAALLSIVADSSGSVAEAAARVHGAMNLPVSNAVHLIPG